MPVAKDWKVSGKVAEKRPEFLSTTVTSPKQKARWDSDLLVGVLQKRRAARLGGGGTVSGDGTELRDMLQDEEESEIVQRFVVTEDGTVEPPRRSRRRANTMHLQLHFGQHEGTFELPWAPYQDPNAKYWWDENGRRHEIKRTAGYILEEEERDEVEGEVVVGVVEAAGEGGESVVLDRWTRLCLSTHSLARNNDPAAAEESSATNEEEERLAAEAASIRRGSYSKYLGGDGELHWRRPSSAYRSPLPMKLKTRFSPKVESEIYRYVEDVEADAESETNNLSPSMKRFIVQRARELQKLTES